MPQCSTKKHQFVQVASEYGPLLLCQKCGKSVLTNHPRAFTAELTRIGTEQLVAQLEEWLTEEARGGVPDPSSFEIN
ncbi:MAG TPA: hypothetical protein VIU62_12490 [Chloroflexota bacterium]